MAQPNDSSNQELDLNPVPVNENEEIRAASNPANLNQSSSVQNEPGAAGVPQARVDIASGDEVSNATSENSGGDDSATTEYYFVYEIVEGSVGVQVPNQVLTIPVSEESPEAPLSSPPADATPELPLVPEPTKFSIPPKDPAVCNHSQILGSEPLYMVSSSVNLVGDTVAPRFTDIPARNRFMRRAFTVSFISYFFQTLLGGILIILAHDFDRLTGIRARYHIVTKNFLRERWGLLVSLALIFIRVILQLSTVCIKRTRGPPNCTNVSLTLFGIIFGGSGAGILCIHTSTLSPLLAILIISLISLYTVLIISCCSCLCPFDIKDCGDCYTCFITLITAALFLTGFCTMAYAPYPSSSYDEYLRVMYYDKHGHLIDKRIDGKYLWPYFDLLLLLVLAIWPVKVLWTLRRVLIEKGHETTENDWMLVGARF